MRLWQKLLAQSGEKQWSYVGAGTLQSATGTSFTAPFPETAQAGDVALLVGSAVVAMDAITGWATTAAGASLVRHRICTGGETSVSGTFGSSNAYRMRVILFRPHGGVASLSASYTSTTTGTSFSAPSGPALLIGHGNNGSAVDPWSVTMPAGAIAVTVSTSTPAIYTAYVLIHAGGAIGSVDISSTTAVARRTFALFTIS